MVFWRLSAQALLNTRAAQRALKIGFQIPQSDSDWESLLAIWRAADETDLFDSAWLSDHLISMEPGAGGFHEAWTLLAALAARTSRLQLGHLVLANTYRHPPLLAKMATTLDHIAHGRFILGLGAGWSSREHEAFGWPLPPLQRRIAMLEASVKLLKAMFGARSGVYLAEDPYTISGVGCDPPPLTPGGPRIWLGIQAPEGIRVAAALADGWNCTADIEGFRSRLALLTEECEAIGRRIESIVVSVQLPAHEDDALNLERAGEFVNSGAEHVVFLLRPGEGPQRLVRLADMVAAPLKQAYRSRRVPSATIQ